MRSHHYSAEALRRGVLSLICGRAVSSALTFGALILVARELEVEAFGVYTILLSALGLAITYTGLGLDWLSARYVPEYRVHGSGADLKRLVGGLLGLRLLSALLLGLAMWATEGLELPWLGLSGHAEAFELYILVIVLEILVRSLRSEVFDPLLMQIHSQANASLRGIVFAVLIVLGMGDGLTLAEVVVADLAASAVSLAAALVQLALAARTLDGHMRADGWRPAPFRDLLAVAGHNYAAQLISSLASPNALMLVGAAMTGPAAMAGFGFCRMLADQVRRYLPITLFAGVARPTIVAAYSMDGRFDRLLERLQMLYKANLLVLLPVTVLAFAFGDTLLAELSAGKVAGGGLVAAGFAVFLVAQSHRVVLSILTNILDRPDLTTAGSLASIAALPLSWAALAAGTGPEGLVAALVVGELLSHVVIIAALAHRGHRYRFDPPSYLRLGACTLLALAATVLLPVPPGDAWAMALAAAASVLAFALLALLLWPFTGYERDSIRALLRRRAGGSAPLPGATP